MASCDHEEADTRMCIHIQDSLQKGARNILVRTVDTNVIVILAGLFFQLQSMYPELDIWVAFGTGKFFRFFILIKFTGILVYPSAKPCPSTILSQGVI